MTMPVTMTTAELSHARRTFERDQATARRHTVTESVSVVLARALVALYLVAGLYAVLAVLGVLPAVGWSVLG